MNKSRIYIVLGVIIVALVAIGAYWGAQRSSVTSPWQTYTNTEYRFQIDHPADWQISAADVYGTPMINIFKPGQEFAGPFTHHSFLTAVSIFPKGVPSDGVRTQSTSTKTRLADSNAVINQGLDFILEDTTVWATMLSFKNVPQLWEAYGFLWAAVTVNNVQDLCVEDGKSVDINNCEWGIPATEAQMIKRGSINAADRATEERMMQSFKFLK